MDGGGLLRRNRRLALGLGALVLTMVGASFAAVPLYDLFCRVTGYGGTTQVAGALPDRVIGDRLIEVRFNADVDGRLPWAFAPETRSVTVHPGEGALIAYRAENQSDRPIVGTAVYNVTPAKAGPYFQKIQCFCFDRQVIDAGQSVDFPVYFYIDPAIADDPAMADVGHITLSYTFFRAASQELAAAQTSYYRDVEGAQAGGLAIP